MQRRAEKKLPENFVQSIGQIGIARLKLPANLSETGREETVETTDFENTTVTKLKNMRFKGE